MAACGRLRPRGDAQQVRDERQGGRLKILFVTGKLAAPLLRDTLDGMRAEFDHEVDVLGISVAALMTTEWVARFLEVPPGVD
ncbi:MAG: DUF6513 domain-containing protein, partial [Gemmatimonadales bacterium]